LGQLPKSRNAKHELDLVHCTTLRIEALMKLFFSGLLVGVILLPVCGWLYFRFGYAPVATASSPIPFERQLARMALRTRIGAEAPRHAPIQASDENFLAGAHVYRTQCAMCHGLPSHADYPTAKGMFPKPPQLFKGHGVTDDPVGETYWKVANGIRLTGMPAYTGSLSDNEIWQVSLMLADSDKLSQQVHATLVQPLEIH
jgi:thiosulfate dehydrogenase